MRIGIDCRALVTGRRTGVEEYVRQLLTHLIPLDRSMTYVLFLAGRHPRLPDDEVFRAANVRPSLHRRSGRALIASMMVRGTPHLDTLCDGVDVFFFPHLIYGSTTPGCPRVCTVHDLSFERFPEHLTLGRRLWHRSMAPRSQVNAADQVIAVSRSTARDVERRYDVRPERISVIHSGVPSSFRPQSEEAIRRFRRDHGLPERFVLAMGTREPRKNLPGLVAAFEHLVRDVRFADVHLVFVGPSGWRERALMNAVNRSSVRDRIHVRREARSEERPLWYASASVLAYPSFFEGFGFPPLEAMAVGTPVVASRLSSLPEVVGDAGLLIDPYRADAIGEALRVFLDDATVRDRCIRLGRERSARFTWERAARRTLDVLTATAR